MSLIPCSIHRIALLGSALLALGFFSGCSSVHSTVQVTEDTIGDYTLGELQVMVDARFAETYEATKAAFEKQGLFLTGDKRKVVEAVLTARDRADTLVTVKIKEVAVGQTSVKIRYGLTGDAARSQALFRDIAARL